MEDYRTIRGTAVGEYVEKKSRFIAQLSFADSEEKAVAFLEQVRAANRTARHNVYAYRLREGAEPAGLRILLVDDICTTGATLAECARVLREAGAADVGCAAAALTPLESDSWKKA